MVQTYDYLYELISYAQPLTPKFPPTDNHWKSLEIQIHQRFPEDYKLLLSSLGYGWFGAGFQFEIPSRLWEAFNHDLLIARREWFTDLITARRLPMYPDRGGYIYIGRMDQQAFFFRPVPGTIQLETIVHLDANTARISFIEEPLTQYLYRLYRGISNDKQMAALRKEVWDDGRGGRLPFFTVAH